MSEKWDIIFNYWFVFWKSDGWRFQTRLANDVWRNLKESINRISRLIFTFSPVFRDLYWSTFIFLENEIFFSSVDGIQVNSPFTFESCLINKCKSYPWRLWNMTGRSQHKNQECSHCFFYLSSFLSPLSFYFPFPCSFLAKRIFGFILLSAFGLFLSQKTALFVRYVFKNSAR